MRMTYLILLTGIAIALSSCTPNPNPSLVPSVPYQNMNPQEFNQFIQDVDVFLLDVHTPEQAHIPGTDAVIAYDTVLAHLDRLPADKDAPIAIYCRSGQMSAEVSETLAKLGYTNISNLESGMNAWKAEGLSIEEIPSTIDVQPIGD